jgi:hypothetical protein
MILAEFVQMVPLFLEFPAFQIRQIVDGIDVIKIVPVGVEPESAGVEGIQGFAVCLRHGTEAAGNASGPGIVDDGIQHGLDISLTDGEGIDAPAVELGQQGQVSIHEGGLLTAPEKKIRKGVFTAPLAAGLKVCIVSGLFAQVQALVWDHNGHFLFGPILP